MRCWSCLSCDRAIRWYYHFRRSVGHLFAVFHVFDAYDGIGSACAEYQRAFIESSLWRNASRVKEQRAADTSRWWLMLLLIVA